jgi:hypothetical protein
MKTKKKKWKKDQIFKRKLDIQSLKTKSKSENKTKQLKKGLKYEKRGKEMNPKFNI